MLLINCEIEIELSWAKECIVIEVYAHTVAYELVTETTEETFQMNNVKRYVRVATLSVNDDNKFLENIKERFKRTIS